MEWGLIYRSFAESFLDHVRVEGHTKGRPFSIVAILGTGLLIHYPIGTEGRAGAYLKKNLYELLSILGLPSER